MKRYVRIWAGKRVWIFDTREGMKRLMKAENKLKMIIGISGK